MFSRFLPFASLVSAVEAPELGPCRAACALAASPFWTVSTEVGRRSYRIKDDAWGRWEGLPPPHEIRVVAPDGTTAGPGVEGDPRGPRPAIAKGY